MLRRIDQEPEMSQIKQLGQKLLPRAGQGENQKAQLAGNIVSLSLSVEDHLGLLSKISLEVFV